MLVIFSAILIANFDATAQSSYATNYVITTEGTFYFEKLRYGLNGFLVATDQTGKKIVFAKDEVKSYQKNGRLFERIQVSETTEFAELVANRNGVKVYRPSGTDNVNNAYLFKGEAHIMSVSQSNLAYVLNFLNDKQGN